MYIYYIYIYTIDSKVKKEIVFILRVFLFYFSPFRTKAAQHIYTKYYKNFTFQTRLNRIESVAQFLKERENGPKRSEKKMSVCLAVCVCEWIL